jgi:hypothetical protein
MGAHGVHDRSAPCGRVADRHGAEGGHQARPAPDELGHRRVRVRRTDAGEPGTGQVHPDRPVGGPGQQLRADPHQRGAGRRGGLGRPAVGRLVPAFRTIRLDWADERPWERWRARLGHRLSGGRA